MADLPDIAKVQGKIRDVTVINPADIEHRFKEYRPEYILITHAIVPTILGTDPIKGLCQRHDINLWCRLLNKPFIRLPQSIIEAGTSKVRMLPFDRALFFVTQSDWQKLRKITDELSIYIDGTCNIGLWERVSLNEIAELNLKPARLNVLGLCDNKRYLKPIAEGNHISFIVTNPHPYFGGIAAKHTELKEQILDQLKDHKLS